MAKPTLQDIQVTDAPRFIVPGSPMLTSDFSDGVPEEDEGEDPEGDEEGDEDEPEADDVDIADEAPEADEAEDADAGDEAGADDEQDGNPDFSFAPFVEDLLEEGGFTLPEGKTMEDYDDTIEGFRAFAKDSANEIVVSAVAGLPPTAQRIMQLALKGGSEEDLQALLILEDGPSWAEADLEEEDVQRAAVEEAMRLREPELTDEEVAERIVDLEDLNKLRKQAERDLKFLQKQDDAKKEALEKQVEAREKEAVKAYEAEVTQVRNYINEQTQVAGLKLTKKDREDFMTYLTVKDREGKTQADRNNSFERRIQKEFLNFKNFSLGALKAEAKTEATKEIRKALARHPGNSHRPNTGSRPSNSPELGKIIGPTAYQGAE